MEGGGWIAAGMGLGSSVIPARANYELPVVASTIAGTSMYGVYTVTDDGLGGDALDCGSPASAGVSESNCYSAFSLGSSSDSVIVSTPPLHYVPAEEYPDAFEADQFVYSSLGQHEIPVASVVGFSSPSHDAATGWAHPPPEHETASFSSCYESHCSSPDSTEAAAVGYASQFTVPIAIVVADASIPSLPLASRARFHFGIESDVTVSAGPAMIMIASAQVHSDSTEAAFTAASVLRLRL
jgi:hypothetical protein